MPSGFKFASKNISLVELVSKVPNGASLALGGSFLHRGPFAFVRELIRQKKTNLEIIKQSPGYDIDILCSCLLYTSPSPRDRTRSRMPSSA